jgi:pimeloyl-ACP methyl ester carboxylesterase
MFADLNGIRMAYSDTGAGSPVALLVHGFPLNRSMWDPQLGILRSMGMRVIAPDLRGFGASESGPPGPLTMEQHADDLVGLLDVLGVSEPVVYVGLSMGGYVGFALWRRNPERVRAFVFADTRASADTPAAREDRMRIARLAEEFESPQPAIDSMLPRLFSPHLRAGSLPERLVRGMMASSSARAVANGQRGLSLRADSSSTLGTITVPTLVIVGEHDVLTPPDESRLIAEGIPKARLVSIDQAGHMSNLENPEAFNEALVEFVKELGPA